MYDPPMNGTNLLLTATVDVRSIAHLARSDPRTRLADYSWALRKWLECNEIESLVFVENSGYDLASLKEIAGTSAKRTEFLSFYGQEFPRHLGKGYGEALNIEYAIENSTLLSETSNTIIRVNGRNYVENIAAFVRALENPAAEILCDLNKCLTWSDGRVLGGTAEFFRRYVCPYGLQADDSKGFYVEHALARAVHRGMADGLGWCPYPEPPIISGCSGTSNRSLEEGPLKRRVRALQHRLKLRMLRL